MNIEEVKEHYKDAKIVRRLSDKQPCEIRYNTIHLWHKDFWVKDCNSRYDVKLWSLKHGFAEITEYKNMKEIKIQVPEGMEIDEANSTFTCIKFKKIEKQLPNTWGEYVETCGYSAPIKDFKYVPDEYIALRKLELLRDCYNDGWKADWLIEDTKYILCFSDAQLKSHSSVWGQYFLNFKTADLRDKFLENFKDIIETAKPLL